MKGDPKVLELLNEALKNELTATNQYWLHYRLLDDWGFTKLAKKEREESIEEMHHADRLVDVKVCAVDATWSGLKLMRRRTK